MAVWPFLWAGAGLALVLALLSRDKRLISVACAICAALVAARVARLGLAEDDAKLALAAAWVGAGATISKVWRADTTSGIIVLSGLCYFWGRLSGAPIQFGQPPYVLADMLAGAAILLTCRGAADVIVTDGGRVVGGGGGRRGFGSCAIGAILGAKKAE